MNAKCTDESGKTGKHIRYKDKTSEKKVQWKRRRYNGTGKELDERQTRAHQDRGDNRDKSHRKEKRGDKEKIEKKTTKKKNWREVKER